MNLIREHVLKVANSKVVKSFYSTLIAKRLKLPLVEVEKEMNKMVKEGLIQKKYQLLCPNGNCLRVLDSQLHKHDFKENYNCVFCGEEIQEGFINEIYTGNNK